VKTFNAEEVALLFNNVEVNMTQQEICKEFILAFVVMNSATSKAWKTICFWILSSMGQGKN